MSTSVQTSTNDSNETKELQVKSKTTIKREKRRESKQEKKLQVKQRREEVLAKKEVGYTGDILNHTDYYFENGLRKVKPYMFKWYTSAKARWFSRTLYDLYSTEFSRVLQNDNLDEIISSGKVRVNGEIKDRNYVIKNGDVLSHLKHRHEIPVRNDPIEIIADNEDYLAVNKPCSIPIHPCGKYRYNSLIIILLKEMNYKNLRTLYRLDRLTSGIVILAKNFKASKILDQHIKNHTVEKTYLTRVLGKFPDEIVEVNQPIDFVSKKAGLFWVNPNGKHAFTRFKLLNYNGKSSVVQCNPKTGRTHQIRIHLQYLGFPILNDPIYNDKRVWGENNGKNGIYENTKEEIEETFLNLHTRDNWLLDDDLENKSHDKDNTAQNDDQNKRKQINSEIMSNNSPKKPKLDIKDDETQLECEQKNISNIEENWAIEYDENCSECKQKCKDPTPAEMVMYLHALSYKFDDFVFKTNIPKWAEENFNEIWN